MFKDKNLAENWTNLAENLKKIEFCRTRRTRFLQLCRCQAFTYAAPISTPDIEYATIPKINACGNFLGDMRNCVFKPRPRLKMYQNM